MFFGSVENVGAGSVGVIVGETAPFGGFAVPALADATSLLVTTCSSARLPIPQAKASLRHVTTFLVRVVMVCFPALIVHRPVFVVDGWLATSIVRSRWCQRRKGFPHTPRGSRAPRTMNCPRNASRLLEKV
jgi:hypothetical protein